MATAAGTAAAATACTSLRAAPRSRAVESFLRNFEHERARLAEVLEIALCYGALCLAQNFSLRGMSVEELRAVTEYDTIKKRDFFVRNAGISARSRISSSSHQYRDRASTRTPLAASLSQQQHVRLKPPHSWRDGNDDAEILEPPTILQANEPNAPSTTNDTTTATAIDHVLSNAIDSSPVAAKPLDTLDVFATLFGQRFVDAAFTAFVAGGSDHRIDTRTALDSRFLRVDQRKSAVSFPVPALPVVSFDAFVAAYVLRCVAHYTPVAAGGGDAPTLRPDDDTPQSQSQQPLGRRVQADASVSERQVPRTTRAAAAVSTAKPSSTHKPLTRTPRSLAHVQSKLKPELDAKRKTLKRVQTTQTQVLKERLARLRLAELDAKRSLETNNSSSDAHRLRRVPLADISAGAAALEIADDFMKSPLLERFSGQENDSSSSNVQRSTQTDSRDALHDELYGATAALSDSFLGCKAPSVPRPRAAAKATRPPRRYNGWLGDFGPLHTKTVVSEWGAPDDDDDVGSDANSTQQQQSRDNARTGSNSRRASAAAKFEWTFDRADGASPRPRNGAKRPSLRPTTARSHGDNDDDRSSSSSSSAIRKHEQAQTRHPTGDDVQDDSVDRDDSDVSDSNSDASCVSDPVFEWLKRAV